MNLGLSRQKISYPSHYKASLLYHDIFDYPLKNSELEKWKTGEKVTANVKIKDLKVIEKGGYYFLSGRQYLIPKRLLRKKSSESKLKIAGKAADILSVIPTVKMVAVTGALAMENADEDSDVDLMIITQKGALWTTRLISLLLLDLLMFPRRKYSEVDQKDKLCLNIWLDEGDLDWRGRNIFTAHEIAQIKPLVNKDKVYERFIYENSWIKDYWSNATRISRKRQQGSDKRLITYCLSLITMLLEPFAFWFQYLYMKDKITRETVTPTRALFHPVDWGEIVTSKLERI